ncbi:MAG: hypothetical protein QXF88_00490 [Candidatus Aenigmatarchaeota archaeon]
MKGIAFSTIAYMIIALAALIVLLTLIGNKIYPSAKNGYCKFLIGLRTVLPLPSHMKSDIPSMCKVNDAVYMETVEILSGDPLRIAFNIASYSKACWEKTANLNYNKNVLCYELVLRRLDSSVTFEMVENYLGTDSNIIIWSGDIERVKSIGIMYDYTENKIRVV